MNSPDKRGQSVVYFSSLLFSEDKTVNEQKKKHGEKIREGRLRDAENIRKALEENGVGIKLIENTKDIWARDFMPVRTQSGKYVSFKYDPIYLKDDPDLITDYKKDIDPVFPLPGIIYSEINLDGGNIVFSPSRKKAIISKRIFEENAVEKAALVRQIENLLEAELIIIDAFSYPSDMTGHADGMVRFVNETTAFVNRPKYGAENTLENRIEETLAYHGIDVEHFPYKYPGKDSVTEEQSAVSCYVNYLETEECIFLPVFGIESDEEAQRKAKEIFKKRIVPVKIDMIARNGGVLNCISWEK